MHCCCCCCCCCCCEVVSVVSESVWPHGWQPTRPRSPWGSLGKNTGVGCHVLLQCMKVKSESEVAQSCPTLCDPMDCSLPGSSIHGIFQARVLEWGPIAFSNLTYYSTSIIIFFTLNVIVVLFIWNSIIIPNEYLTFLSLSSLRNQSLTLLIWNTDSASFLFAHANNLLI